jgi:opine dehydrogenase
LSVFQFASTIKYILGVVISMKVAVLGSGNGAHAIAFEWARAGHEVYMFDFKEFTKAVVAINAAGGIRAEGEMEGFEKIVYAGYDIEQVITGADIVFAVGPAYSTEPFGKACKPYVKPGQIFVVCPSSCMGSVVFKRALGLDISDESIIVSETSTLPRRSGVRASRRSGARARST